MFSIRADFFRPNHRCPLLRSVAFLFFPARSTVGCRSEQTAGFCAYAVSSYDWNLNTQYVHLFIALPSILKSLSGILSPPNQNPELLVSRIGSIHLTRQRKASRRCWKLSTRARVLPSRCSGIDRGTVPENHGPLRTWALNQG